MSSPADPLHQALQFTLQWEGGYVNDPRDPGGATNKGVTQATYDSYRRKKGQPTAPVKGISDAEVQAIYETLYWAAAQCDKLPWPLSAAHFDSAVNAGPKQAAKLLQRALHVADDGIIGPGTLAAAQAADPVAAADGDCDARLAFYQALVKSKPTLGAFLKGWTRRVEALRVFCGAAAPSFDPMEHAPEPTHSLLRELEDSFGL